MTLAAMYTPFSTWKEIRFEFDVVDKLDTAKAA